MRALLFLLLLAVAASAQVPTRVVIYKGTAAVPLPPNRLTYSAAPHVYFLHQVVGSSRYNNVLVLYYTTGAGKKLTVIDMTYFYSLDLTEAASPTRTVDALSFWNQISDGNNIGLQSFYVRGDLKPIQISANSGGAGSFVRNFVGTYRDTQYNSPGNVTTITELGLNVSFDAKHTLAANSGAKTFADILSELETELNGLGYR